MHSILVERHNPVRKKYIYKNYYKIPKVRNVHTKSQLSLFKHPTDEDTKQLQTLKD